MPALFGPKGTVGGGERYAFELARNMALRVPTTLVTFGEVSEQYKVDELNIHVLGNAWKVRGQEFNRFHWKLPFCLGRAEIIHCHQQHLLASSLAAFIAVFTRAKCFVSDLGGGGWDISGYLSTDNWYRGHLHISQYSRRIFGHENRKNARVILGGVDTGKFVMSARVRKESLVVFAGRIMPHKGIDYLIQALPEGLRLEVIGRPYDAAFTERLREMSIGKEVQFRHECDDEQLVDAYRRALCVVLPSVYRTSDGAISKVPELLGQTLIEGMACGTAAICSDVASMPEIVLDQEVGFVVPPNDPVALGDRLKQLRDNTELAVQMGKAARARVESNFTWGTVVDRCLEAYATL